MAEFAPAATIVSKDGASAPSTQHPGVELAAHLQLGAPGAQRALGGQLGQRLVGDGAGPSQRLDLVVVLDRALGLDRPADRGQLGHRSPVGGVGEHLLQRGEPVDGEVVGLVPEPAHPAPHGLPGERRRRSPRSTSSSTSGTCVPACVVYRPSVPKRSAPSVRTSSAPLEPVNPVR